MSNIDIDSCFPGEILQMIASGIVLAYSRPGGDFPSACVRNYTGIQQTREKFTKMTASGIILAYSRHGEVLQVLAPGIILAYNRNGRDFTNASGIILAYSRPGRDFPNACVRNYIRVLPWF